MKRLFLILSLLFSGNTVTQTIPNISFPQQIIFSSFRNVILVKDEYVFRYDIFSNSLEQIGLRNGNDFVGIDENGDLEFCSIEHRLISSKDDYSTVFRVNGKELKFFETIRPIKLDGNVIVAVTALDFLEQHYYKIDIDTGLKQEIPVYREPMDSNLGMEEDINGNVVVRYSLRELVKEDITKYLSSLIEYLLQLRKRFYFLKLTNV